MKFLDNNLLLDNDLAVTIYNEHAKDLPIIDYHSHLSPQEIAADRKFYNLAELWLKGDHYKWRLMRNCGVDEKYITGAGSDREKFRAFSGVLPLCIGNPIYIWCHLELKTYFNITAELNADSADEIYERTEALMRDGSYSAQKLILRSNVSALCTTDDPADDLHCHRQIAASGFPVKVYPTFRPDKILNIDAESYVGYVKSLTGKKRPALSDILAALTERLDFFQDCGCFASDHALDNYTFADCIIFDAEDIVEKAMKGEYLSDTEIEQYKTFMLSFLAAEYSKRNMVMQLHFCCQRNINGAMYARLGPDTGFDAVNSSKDPCKLAAFFNMLAVEDVLPKTIVYSLDANDDKMINTVINSFQGGIRGKLQHGSAWWFNDTKDGIKSHLKTLSEYSVLGNFIGMLTDSRSFTSYVRHDYFRRILCSHIAEYVLAGEYPKNSSTLKTLIESICFYNAKTYFNL